MSDFATVESSRRAIWSDIFSDVFVSRLGEQVNSAGEYATFEPDDESRFVEIAARLATLAADRAVQAFDDAPMRAI